MPKCILTEQGGKGSGISLISIEVTTRPNKVSYIAGDHFDSTGMVVTASYGIGQAVLTTAEVNKYSVSPEILTDGVTSVTITYSERGKTCTTTTPITVVHRLTAIAVTTNPTKTIYEYGDTLDTTDMVVTASYSDSVSKTITGTGYACSPTTFSTVGNQVVTVSYTENEINQTATFNVTVNRKSVAKPTWKNNLTYNESAQSVSSSSYWNNYNSSYMTIGGTTSATDAGTYIATFTPKSNYRWTDETTSAIDVNWTINRAAGDLSVNPTTVALNSNNYSSGVAVTITRAGDGTISYNPTNVNGLTMSLNGNTLTIKGDGSTAIASQTITISVAQGTNHTAPSNKTITVSAEYWSWGSETAIGSSDWWTGLEKWITDASESELAACVGKTKSVTLNTAVQGTTTHLVRCIGYNCDHDINWISTNTLTFQTANTLANTLKFNNGDSDMRWVNAYIRTSICEAYYNAFPGRRSIVTTSQGTCNTINDSQAGTPTYNDERVFLPSDCQMGFPKGADSSNGKGYSASYDEFDQYNISKTPYQYYTSNNSRIKNQGDSGSACNYWERSLCNNNTHAACCVSNDGKPDYYFPNDSIGFAPAFVIGS